MGHVVHEEPQELTLVFSQHWLLQAWEPGLQETPQDTPLHVAEPLKGVGHAKHDEPQLETLWSLAQTPLHR